MTCSANGEQVPVYGNIQILYFNTGYRSADHERVFIAKDVEREATLLWLCEPILLGRLLR